MMSVKEIELCSRCGIVPLLGFIETKGENAGICTPCLIYGADWWKTNRRRFEDVMKLRPTSARAPGLQERR